MAIETLEDWTKRLGVVETDGVHNIEVAIFKSTTFQVLISQSGNDAYACARDIAREVAKALRIP